MTATAARVCDPLQEFSRCLEEFRRSADELRATERSLTHCVRALEATGASPARLLAARSILHQVRAAIAACEEVRASAAAVAHTEAITPPRQRPIVTGTSAPLAEVAT